MCEEQVPPALVQSGSSTVSRLNSSSSSSSSSIRSCTSSASSRCEPQSVVYGFQLPKTALDMGDAGKLDPEARAGALLLQTEKLRALEAQASQRCPGVEQPTARHLGDQQAAGLAIQMANRPAAAELLSPVIASASLAAVYAATMAAHETSAVLPGRAAASLATFTSIVTAALVTSATLASALVAVLAAARPCQHPNPTKSMATAHPGGGAGPACPSTMKAVSAAVPSLASHTRALSRLSWAVKVSMAAIDLCTAKCSGNGSASSRSSGSSTGCAVPARATRHLVGWPQVYKVKMMGEAQASTVRGWYVGHGMSVRQGELGTSPPHLLTLTRAY